MESLIRRFYMKHMPNLMNGDFWQEMEKYLDGNPRGYHRNLLIDFIDEHGGIEDYGEVLTRVFGVGESCFSFNEHNLYSVPMSRLPTIRDAVNTLTEEQNKLFEEYDGKVPEAPKNEYVNLWARYITSDGSYRAITINNIEIATHFVLQEEFGMFLEEISPSELHIDHDTGELQFTYRSKEEENTRPYLYAFIHDYYEKIVDYVLDTYSFPRGIIIGGDEKEVVSYTFTDFKNDAIMVSTERFEEDVAKLNVIHGDVNGMIKEIVSEPLKEAKQEIAEEFPKLIQRYGHVSPIRKNRIYAKVEDFDE